MAWRKPASVSEWISIGTKRWTLFLFPALVVMVAVCLASFKIERVYQAEAKFRRMNDVAMGNSQEGMGARQLDAVRMTYQYDLRGKAAVSQLIDDLGLAKDLPHTADGALTAEGQILKNELIRSMQGRLGLSFDNATEQLDDITVSFIDKDRELAPRVVNQLVENYIRKTKQELNEVLLKAKVFFDKESERYRNKVQELENKKLRFGMQNPGLMPDDPSSVQTKLIESRARLTAVTQELEVARERSGALEVWVNTQPETIDRPIRGENPALRELLNRKTAAENDLDRDLTFFRRTEDHPSVKSNRARIAEIEKKIVDTEAQIQLSNQSEQNPARIEAMRDLQLLRGTTTALDRQREELTAQVDQLEVLSRNFFAVRSEYTKIDRELEEATEQARFWEDKLRNTQIALSAEFNEKGMRLSFQQRAEVAKPSSPKLAKVLAAALVLGCAVGGAMVILSELLDSSFRNADQAMDDLKLPVLGAVSEIVSPAQAFRRRIVQFAVYPALATIMVMVLLVTFWLIHLSLEDTVRFEQMVSSPGSFIKQTIMGRG